MKNEKRNKLPKLKKGFRLAFTLLLLAIAITFMLLVFAPLLKSKDDPEHTIVGKLNSQHVVSRFTPVLIYRLDNGKAFFAGSGSLCVGSEGEQILTSEHLFRNELGNSMFGFRKLRPLEPEIAHGLNRILHKGVELALRPGELPDVVIVKTGITNSIDCYSDRTLLLDQSQADVSKINETANVRSLVSGESVRIVGVLKSVRDAGTEYAILEYSSISGESGTGFVDENDHLYVLKGVPEWSDEVKDRVEKLLGTTRKLSIAYGPFQFRE